MAVVQNEYYKILIDEDDIILKSFIDQLKPSKIFILVDSNTKECCLPAFEKSLKINFTCLQIPAGEENKNLNTCSAIWSALIANGADRKSLLINLGGGVIGDIGGFIASCYMRGIRFIQVPTTLLSQVDASCGGKVGIDFEGYKNMIGSFVNPELVWIKTNYLQTLDEREIKSGFAEVIKHALIRSSNHWKKVTNMHESLQAIDWGPIILESVQIKNEVVNQDFKENGIRKILNFGHTIGHAIESHYLTQSRPLTHGEAIAVGMVCEAHISFQKSLLSSDELKKISSFIHKVFTFDLTLSKDFDNLYMLMMKDKKNISQAISMSLLDSIGHCIVDQHITREEIKNAFIYYENSFN